VTQPNVSPPVALKFAKEGDRIIIFQMPEEDGGRVLYAIKEVRLATPKFIQVGKNSYYRDNGESRIDGHNQRLVDPTPEIIEAVMQQNNRMNEKKLAKDTEAEQKRLAREALIRGVQQVLLTFDPATIVSCMTPDMLIEIYHVNQAIQNLVALGVAKPTENADGNCEGAALPTNEAISPQDQKTG
jgi:hypothetical protein